MTFVARGNLLPWRVAFLPQTENQAKLPLAVRHVICHQFKNIIGLKICKIVEHTHFASAEPEIWQGFLTSYWGNQDLGGSKVA